jgi:hypothetical protein
MLQAGTSRVRVPTKSINFFSSFLILKSRTMALGFTQPLTEMCKCKASHATGSGGLYGCEMSRIPHCLDSRLKDGGKVVSPTHPALPGTIIFLLLVLISVRG